MTFQKPDLHVLTVWRIRLLAVSLIPSFLSAYSARHIDFVWWLFLTAWMLAFLYFYIFYYPIKYRKLSYSLNRQCFIIHCGVIYTRVKAIPFSSIEYVVVYSTPLQRLFSICSLYICTAGSSAYIPGLTQKDAEQLQRTLTPPLPEEGDVD